MPKVYLSDEEKGPGAERVSVGQTFGSSSGKLFPAYKLYHKRHS